MQQLLLVLCTISLLSCPSDSTGQAADTGLYLNTIKAELKKEWPENRTINLVFHGHSVSAGYFKTPEVNTLVAYPHQLLKLLKDEYPYAVINIINTSIGGENSESGSHRFESEVLPHRPDVVFIDYALNDRGLGVEKSQYYWREIIEKAKEKNIKIILFTPSPDQREDILSSDSTLGKYAKMIHQLATEYQIGLVDSYHLFKSEVQAGAKVSSFMSQVNHPNEKGHLLIANAIFEYFK